MIELPKNIREKVASYMKTNKVGFTLKVYDIDTVLKGIKVGNKYKASVKNYIDIDLYAKKRQTDKRKLENNLFYLSNRATNLRENGKRRQADAAETLLESNKEIYARKYS